MQPKDNKPAAAAGEGVRLQKALAELGFGSRREIEGWIKAGRIDVNGQRAELGVRVGPSDRISIDGREIKRRRHNRAQRRVLLYNKPVGEVVSRHDPEGRPSIFSRLPSIKDGRWIAVGRLDLNTSGLILLTNDGDLANRLMHPSGEIEREYAVRVHGEPSRDLLQQLVKGVELDDGPARFEEIVESGGEGANRWFHVLLREGRNREVRRLWEAVGVVVSRLKRVRFGNIMLDSRLHVGRWREATAEEVSGLMALVGLEAPRAKPRATGPRRNAARGARKRPVRD